MENTFGAEYLERIDAVYYHGASAKSDCLDRGGFWANGRCKEPMVVND